MGRLTKCKECHGTGHVEWVGGVGRPCDACGGEGEFNMRARVAAYGLTERDLPGGIFDDRD